MCTYLSKLHLRVRAFVCVCDFFVHVKRQACYSWDVVSLPVPPSPHLCLTVSLSLFPSVLQVNRILFVRNLPFKITAEEVCFHLEQRDEYSIFLTKMCLFMGERLQLGVHVCACVPVRLRAGVPLSVRLCVCVSLCVYFSVSVSLCVRLRGYDRVQLGDTGTYADVC